MWSVGASVVYTCKHVCVTHGVRGRLVQLGYVNMCVSMVVGACGYTCNV